MASGTGKQPPAPPPTKTGGDDGDGDFAKQVAQKVVDDATSKTRKGFVVDDGFEFHPSSLVGSWFHRLENDRMIWQGVVVAEPQPGKYLVQIDKLDVGSENVQRLVTLEAMVNDEDGYDWRFYDTENEARSAYAQWVATERDRTTV